MVSKYLILISFLSLISIALIPSKRSYSRASMNCPDSGIERLGRSYLYGEKSCVPKKVKEQHRILGLYHLMTPSGMHLSSLLIPAKKFIQLFKIHQHMSVLFIFCIWAFVQTLEKYYSLKRMSHLYIIKALMPKISNRISIAFMIALDLISSNAFLSPLSFALSCMFIIIIFESRSNAERFFYFLLAQATIAIIFKQSFYPIGSLLGFGVGIIFCFIFPLIAISQLLNWHGLQKLLLSPMLEVIDFFTQVATQAGKLPLHGLSLLFLLVFIFRKPQFLWLTILWC